MLQKKKNKKQTIFSHNKFYIFNSKDLVNIYNKTFAHVFIVISTFVKNFGHVKLSFISGISLNFFIYLISSHSSESSEMWKHPWVDNLPCDTCFFEFLFPSHPYFFHLPTIPFPQVFKLFTFKFLLRPFHAITSRGDYLIFILNQQ